MLFEKFPTVFPRVVKVFSLLGVRESSMAVDNCVILVFPLSALGVSVSVMSLTTFSAFSTVVSFSSEALVSAISHPLYFVKNFWSSIWNVDLSFALTALRFPDDPRLLTIDSSAGNSC